MYDSDDEEFDFDSEQEESVAVDVESTLDSGSFWDIAYRNLDQAQVLQEAEGDVGKVQDLLMCDRELCSRLLRLNEWRITDAVEGWLADPDGWMDKCGLVAAAKQEPQHGMQIRSQEHHNARSCCICYEPVSVAEQENSPCGHYVCASCLSRYVEECLKNGTNITYAQFIKCPWPGCKMLFSDSTVLATVASNASLVSLANQRIIRYYVSSHKSTLRWCLSPDCPFLLQLTGKIPGTNSSFGLMPAVRCSCGCSFCFACGQQPSHIPLPCKLLSRWLHKCVEDAETALWFVQNTKLCPKCKVSIEKNAGCNHMTCRNCTYQYCWVCLEAWHLHNDNYRCHVYKQSRKEAKDAGEALEFYIFHYNRFINHQKAAVFQNVTLRGRFQSEKDAYQSATGISWMQFDWIFDTIDALVYTRGILQYIYAFMYYLERNALSQLFEENIKDLEMAVESLSEMLEKQINPTNVFDLKPPVINKTGYMRSRTRTLIYNTLADLLEDRWRFSSYADSQPSDE